MLVKSPRKGISPAEVQAHSIGALLVEAIAGTPKQQTRRAGGGNLPEVIPTHFQRDKKNQYGMITMG